jgi:hypothetical protein
VTLALTGRFSKVSKTSRKAVGHLSGKISQTRQRFAAGSDAGATCVRARSKKKAVVKWMNCMVVVRKNLSWVDKQVLGSLLQRSCKRKLVTIAISQNEKYN